MDELAGLTVLPRLNRLVEAALTMLRSDPITCGHVDEAQDGLFLCLFHVEEVSVSCRGCYEEHMGHALHRNGNEEICALCPRLLSNPVKETLSWKADATPPIIVRTENCADCFEATTVDARIGLCELHLLHLSNEEGTFARRWTGLRN
ncbi:MAG: hypothetical protein WEB06_02035 [Actinomycetota bacterium]